MSFLYAKDIRREPVFAIERKFSSKVGVPVPTGREWRLEGDKWVERTGETGWAFHQWCLNPWWEEVPKPIPQEPA